MGHCQFCVVYKIHMHKAAGCRFKDSRLQAGKQEILPQAMRSKLRLY